MPGYTDAILEAYRQGWSYDEIAAHHEMNGMETPPRPSLDQITQGSVSMTPEADWLQGFGPRPNAPSISDTDVYENGAMKQIKAMSDTGNVAQQPDLTDVPGSQDAIERSNQDPLLGGVGGLNTISKGEQGTGLDYSGENTDISQEI